ncbi:MAG: hypothetical protein ABW123_12185 [Cystobacter sp.]
MGPSEEVDPLAALREGEGLESEPATPVAPPPLPPRRPAPVSARPAMTLPAVRSPSRPSGGSAPVTQPSTKSMVPPDRATIKVRPVQPESPATSARESVRTPVADARVARLEAELLQVEADRKDLSRSLADVEGELARLSDELTRERESRGALAEELIGAKEALSLAQDRVSELVTEGLETQGALEAVREEYQSTLVELEQAAERLQESERERELVAAERTGLSIRVDQLEAMLSESAGSSDSLEEVRAHTLEVEAERDEARAAGGDLSTRLELAESEVERLREQMQADAAALGEVVESAEANVTRLEDELRTATADRQDLARALAEVEAELESLRSGASPAGSPSSEEEDVRAERDQLREDVATMKRKLMAAELALETAASHKMKVARLEAQLARLQKEK